MRVKLLEGLLFQRGPLLYTEGGLCTYLDTESGPFANVVSFRKRSKSERVRAASRAVEVGEQVTSGARDFVKLKRVRRLVNLQTYGKSSRIREDRCSIIWGVKVQRSKDRCSIGEFKDQGNDQCNIRKSKGWKT